MSNPLAPTRPGKKEVVILKALYSFTASRGDELSFVEGALLNVIGKDIEGWILCEELESKLQGLVLYRW